MNNNALQLKIKRKLNKIDSNDYDNLPCWSIVQAFNEELLKFSRTVAEKGESTNSLVDDLSILLKDAPIKGVNKTDYFETTQLPDDLMLTKAVEVKALSKLCSIPQRMMVYDGEESNKVSLLRNENINPNFEWRETFKTHVDNKIRIYTQGKFTLTDCRLIYYRKPKPISFEGCVDEYNNVTSDVECELKDDIIEKFLIPLTCASLAGDMENYNQLQRNLQDTIK